MLYSALLPLPGWWLLSLMDRPGRLIFPGWTAAGMCGATNGIEVPPGFHTLKLASHKTDKPRPWPKLARMKPGKLCRCWPRID